MRKYFVYLFLLFGVFAFQTRVAAQSYEFELDLRKNGAPIQSSMYGLFFEDINFGADGGLYAELIKNRSFDFPQALMGWKSFGKVDLRNEGGPFDRNPNYVRLNNSGHGHKHTGIENEGFTGIGIERGKTYRFSVWARGVGNAKQKIRIELIDSRNNPFEHKEIEIDSREWKKYEVILTPRRTEIHASLRVFLASEGPVDLEHVSLFPTDTWKGRENGLRKDLVEALAELKPMIFRFPVDV